MLRIPSKFEMTAHQGPSDMATKSKPRLSRFVLYSMPRTGSNMMVSRLRRHPDIMCRPAIFSPKGWTKISSLSEVRMNKMRTRLVQLPARYDKQTTRVDEMPRFLEEFAALFDDYPCFGFKHHLAAPDNDATRKLVDQKWPAIILNRENILASYSSNKLVRVTGQGALRRGAKPKKARVRFDAEEFAAFVAYRQGCTSFWEEQIAESGVPVLSIEYCEARERDGMDRVGEFLGFDPDLFRGATTVKRNPDDIVSRFVNLRAVRAYLAEHALEHWARED